MHRHLAALFAFLLLSGGARAVQTAATPASSQAWQEMPAWSAVFERAGLRGTALLYDVQADRWHVHDAERARTGFVPASTFKVFNALVALETGVVPDEHAPIAWDGTERRIPQWNRDTTLAGGMRHSTVWFYQAMARRIGEERMQHWIDAAGYGNRDIGGGIDRFWLDGALRISAEQQVMLLRRLADGTLPFAPRVQEAVRRILLLEDGPDYALHGKTGWATDANDGVDLGWFVGWADRGGRRVVFALNLDLPAQADGAQRQLLARRLLVDAGVLPEQAARPMQ